MPFPSPGRIFISYRRKETGAHAGRLRDHLAARFGDEQLFMDVENLEPGVDFHKVIRAVVATCAVQVVVIGPGWAAATDERGHRRLDDPDDLVRIEVEAALAREVRVIPVLIEQAAMPRPGELPESLAGLVRRQALRVRHETFRADADRLVLAVEKVLSASAAASTVVSLAVTIRARRAHVLPHRGWVNEVAFSPGGRWLATASDDGTARIWNAATGEERRQLPHDDKVSGLAFGPDRLGLATAGDDHAARIWNAATGKQRLLLPHDGAVWGVAFSPDGRWLATASWDQTAGASIWDIAVHRDRPGQRLRLAHDGPVLKVAFSPDGRWLATAGTDGTARIWNAATRQERRQLPHDDKVRAVAFSPDGRWLATAGADGAARIWDTATGKQRLRLAHHGSVLGVAFSPDGRWLATASTDRTARIWDTATGHRCLHLSHEDLVSGVAFSPDGRWLATAAGDQRARVWALVDLPPA